MLALNDHPGRAAFLLGDQHLNSNIQESARILAYALLDRDPKAELDKRLLHGIDTRFNHPWAKWVRENPKHYDWVHSFCKMSVYQLSYRMKDWHEYGKIINTVMEAGRSAIVEPDIHYFPLVVDRELESMFGFPGPNGYVQSYNTRSGYAAYQIHFLKHKMEAKGTETTWKHMPYKKAMESQMSFFEKDSPFDLVAQKLKEKE